MALPLNASGTKLLIQVGDGATPEEFNTSLTCALIAKTANFSADANSIAVPDCDDPDLPASNLTEITAKSFEISGSGVAKTDAIEDWHDWFQSGEARNCRISVAIPAADGGGYWACSMKVTALQFTGERGNKIQMEVTLQADGAVIWTAAT